MKRKKNSIFRSIIHITLLFAALFLLIKYREDLPSLPARIGERLSSAYRSVEPGIGDLFEDAGMEEAAQHFESEDAVHLTFGSDIHYLSQSLTDNSETFHELALDKSGKAMMYIEEITEAFLENVSEEQPDALILGGDLTYYGETQSHRDLIEKLAALQDSGIPVLVIPGNHDVGFYGSYSYSEAGQEETERTYKGEFREFYYRFGPEQSLTVDDNSFSYLYPLTEDLGILMIDANAGEWEDEISEETLAWVEETLAEYADDMNILAVSHEPFLDLDDSDENYTQIDKSEEFLSLFETYGVEYGFSGHLHYHTEGTSGSFRNIVTSCVSVYPLQYGEITLDRGQLRYESQYLNMPAWAAEHGIEDENLENFWDYAREQQQIYAARRDARKAEEESQ